MSNLIYLGDGKLSALAGTASFAILTKAVWMSAVKGKMELNLKTLSASKNGLWEKTWIVGIIPIIFQN